jgi:hypothetical protein
LNHIIKIKLNDIVWQTNRIKTNDLENIDTKILTRIINGVVDSLHLEMSFIKQRIESEKNYEKDMIRLNTQKLFIYLQSFLIFSVIGFRFCNFTSENYASVVCSTICGGIIGLLIPYGIEYYFNKICKT